MVKFEDVKNITTEEYFKNNKYAVDIFNEKYAHKKEKDEKETPAEVFWRVSKELSEFEKEDKKENICNIWFDLLWNDWFRPGGSIISGIGSGKKCSLANCCTIPIEGDTLEDIIAKAEYSLAKCAAYRQGMGIDLSNLRPRGAKLGNAAEESTGIVPWGKKFSSIGNFVGQRGRMPAILESLKIYHPDIEEFINSKRKTGEIENANISVQVTDDFMESLKNKKKWILSFETEREKIEKEIDPEYLFDLISEAAIESAEPGIQYIDKLKKGTILDAVYKDTGKDVYKIISSNACCFTDNMAVSTNKGNLLISEIKEKFNDREELEILSYDIENDSFEFQKLEDVHVRDNGNPQEIIEICIENDNGDIKTIECTSDHKIYTKNRGYVKAIELSEDDILLEC